MRPTAESAAPSAHQTAPRAKRRSMITTVAADEDHRREDEALLEREGAVDPGVARVERGEQRRRQNGGPPGTPTPAARSPFFAISAPQAATPGSSPTTTAGACSRGVAWNACAVMTMPIQSTIAMPASIGTAQAMCDSVPVRQTTRRRRAPFSTE